MTQGLYNPNMGGYQQSPLINPLMPASDYGLGSMGSWGQQGGVTPGIDGGLRVSPSQAVSFAPGAGAAPAAAAGGGWLDGFWNKSNPNGTMDLGWGGQALGAAQGLFNSYMGMQQYGLYKDQLAQSKKEFGLNYDAQRSTTNAALEDRQRARVASNSGAYQSVGDYMQQNGIQGR